VRPREREAARSQSREKSPSLSSFAYAGAAAISFVPRQSVRWRASQPVRAAAQPDRSRACSQAWQTKGVDAGESSASQSARRTSLTVVKTRTSGARMTSLPSVRPPPAQLLDLLVGRAATLRHLSPPCAPKYIARWTIGRG